MGWRIISIDESQRLNYSLNHIGVMSLGETIWISLEEIDTIILSDLRCNVSVRLLKELAELGITVIICDSHHNPNGMLSSINNNSRTSKNTHFQIEWEKSRKQELWKTIVQYKIIMQRNVLKILNKKEKLDLLSEYIKDVKIGDISNREGHAAKVYFRQLFGNGFSRENDDIINSSLNYIYQIIRARISQEIIAHGYIPSLGLFHCSEYNGFNFSDDLIEVFRPICDLYVYKIIERDKPVYMNSSHKNNLLNFLVSTVCIKNSSQKIINAIRIYLESIFNYMNKIADEIYFPIFEENYE